jgi:ubiquinone/menaquinone biosynthesis C-methylase UbiE
MERHPNFINDKIAAGSNLCSLVYMEIKMSDPFQNVDNAGISFAQTTAETMELRQSEPIMESLVLNYLKQLEFKKNSLSVEIGCGAGSISRRISKHVEAGQVLGFDPSANYIEMAKKKFQRL